MNVVTPTNCNTDINIAHLVGGTAVVFHGMKMDGAVIVDHNNGSRERISPSQILTVTGPNGGKWKDTVGGKCRAGNCPWTTSTGACDHD